MRAATFLILVLFSLVSARAQAAEPLASVPYRLDYNGWYTVDLMINGQGPYQFIVDTGATLTAVFENITEQQAFAPAEEPEKRVLGIVGAQALPAINMGEIDVGGLKMANHTGVVIPDWDGEGPKPQGVLGLDFLSKYTVLFDASRRRIEFYAPSNPPKDAISGMSSANMRYSTFNRDYGGLYTITVSMSGRRIPCIVDLGADGTLINYSAMRRLLGGLYVDPPRATGSTTGSRIRDVFGDEARARSIEVRPIRIGAARWGSKTFVVYNAGIFQALGIHRKSYGLLGADLLRDRSFVFDFTDRRFYVSRQPVVDAS